MVLQTKMMVMQIPDHHLGSCQNALCHKELLKCPEQDDGMVQTRVTPVGHYARDALDTSYFKSTG
jgi:hypothetical protein